MALETDDEFLDYMYWHSKTERHLFHRDHVRRLLMLSGHENPDEILAHQGEFLGVGEELALPLVEKARGLLAPVTP